MQEVERRSRENNQVTRLIDAAREKSEELREQANERDLLHPGADELPDPVRGELFSASSRWKMPNFQEPQTADQPLITVVIPVYNKQGVMRRCLETVLGQTYTNLQVILVNDGSKDESLAVMSWLVRNDPRVEIIDKENGGVSSARNAALSHVRGSWLYFCDADDWLEPNCIESLLTAVRETNADMAICDFFRVLGNRYYVSSRTSAGAYTLPQFVEHMTKRPANYYYGALWNKLFNTNIIADRSLSFDPAIPFGEDHLFILDYLMASRCIAVVDQPLYYYVDSPGSLMHQGLNPAGIARNKTAVVEKYAQLCDSCGLAETAADILRIASFLVTPATDGMVSPFDKVLRSEQIPCSE